MASRSKPSCSATVGSLQECARRVSVLLSGTRLQITVRVVLVVTCYGLIDTLASSTARNPTQGDTKPRVFGSTIYLPHADIVTDEIRTSLNSLSVANTTHRRHLPHQTYRLPNKHHLFLRSLQCNAPLRSQQYPPSLAHTHNPTLTISNHHQRLTPASRTPSHSEQARSPPCPVANTAHAAFLALLTT